MASAEWLREHRQLHYLRLRLASLEAALIGRLGAALNVRR